MGALSKDRWTALDLERAGVRFIMRGAADIRVIGPAGRADALEALRAEVARRVGAMRGGARVITTSPTRRTGACDCCGDPMRPYRGGHCPLCILALDRVRAARRS